MKHTQLLIVYVLVIVCIPSVLAAAPVIINPQPADLLPAGTEAVLMHVQTDVDGACSYSPTPTTWTGGWYAFPQFGSANGFEHSVIISNLSNGQTYLFYVRCLNWADGLMTYFNISFTVGTPTNNTIYFASHDFEDNTIGMYMGSAQPDIAIVADPASSGRGNVLRIHYVGNNQDRNINIGYDKPDGIGLGETIFFKGDLYYPAGTNTDPAFAGRKILYFQRNDSNNVPEFYSVTGGFGLSAYVDNGYVPPTGGSIITARNTNFVYNLSQWYTIEVQITMNSDFGTSDGIYRLWIDGDLIYENTTLRWSHPGWTVNPSQVIFRYFNVGDQVNSAGSYDEYRYWDNVQFTSQRVVATQQSTCEATGGAKCYYVSPSGTDEVPTTTDCQVPTRTGAINCNVNGTYASPWKSLTKAAYCAQPGDIIYLMNGSYGTSCSNYVSYPSSPSASFAFYSFRSGSPGNPITIRNYPGERPVFTNVLELSNDYHAISGLEFSGTYLELTVARNTTIRNSHFHDASNVCSNNVGGIRLYGNSISSGPENTLIENNTIHDNYDHTAGSSWTANTGVFNCAGIKVAHGAVNVTIRNNTIYNNPAGIHLKYNGEGRGMQIVNNTFFNASWAVYSSNDNWNFSRNVVYDTTVGIAVEGRTGTGQLSGFNVTVEYNTFVNNSQSIEISSGNTSVRNNILYNPAVSCIGFNVPCSIMIYDGFYSDGGFAGPNLNPLTMDSNCYYTPGNIYRWGHDGSGNQYYNLTQVRSLFSKELAGVFADPLFVNVAARNYRLQSGSSCAAMGAYGTGVAAIPGDINGDGVVNMSDLVIVVSDLGRTTDYDGRADVNTDGVISVHDLVIVGQNWGRTS
jgi:parallel beta-helix repeat protein